MQQSEEFKREIVRFSRIIALLFNRVTMYHINHPFMMQTIEDFSMAVEQLLGFLSPLVFIMVQDRMFLDEEPFDPNVNVSRVVAHFKKTGTQSIYFQKGLTKNEIRTFLEVFTSLDQYPNVESMKKALTVKGVRNMKLNHVVYQRVTENDEVISQETLKKLSPEFADDAQRKSKKLLVDLLIENLLSEQLMETLAVDNIARSPAAPGEAPAEGGGPAHGGGEAPVYGEALMHQLDLLGREVEKNLQNGTDMHLTDVAASLFKMKKSLMERLEAQKTLEIPCGAEEVILQKVNDITDSVVLRIIKDEYKRGETSTPRLAQIVRRLVPEPRELKRLLPHIKTALQEEGMVLTEYRAFFEELSRELQSEQLVQVLQESSEQIGVNGERLIKEIKENPAEAAELIYLAAELRKGSGDEGALSDLLVEYMERIGSKLALDFTEEGGVEGRRHLRQTLSAIESSIVGRLREMDLGEDLLRRLEEKFNLRIDDVLDKIKMEWIRSQASQTVAAAPSLSVLQILEQSTGRGDDLGIILAVIRTKADAGEIDENDFAQIHAEIIRQKRERIQQEREKMPAGLLDPSSLMFLIKKEIARAKRYGVPFSALSFCLVGTVSQSGERKENVASFSLKATLVRKIMTLLRDSDIVGQLGKGRIVALLPLTSPKDAQSVLRRCLRVLHGEYVQVEGVSLTFKVAGVATSFDPARTPDVRSFIHVLSADLAHMEMRIRNIQAFM